LGLKEVRDGRVDDLWWQIKSPALRIDRMSEPTAASAPTLFQSDRA
jgi:hypothetical protein